MSESRCDECRYAEGMPSVTRKLQANREERRERIERQLLDATDRLMADGTSFTELSADKLATEAGISRASFYIYFEDKGHLLRRLATQVFGDLDPGRPTMVERRRTPRPCRRPHRHVGHRRQLSDPPTGADRAHRDVEL